ncbi:MAG: restriction endonuclease, partial [Asgard group archaeon]
MSYEKGHRFEEEIEQYFQLNGYETQRNVVIEGNFGAKHEIDVLAEKSDPVTSLKVMVECKAWDKPVEKDVVSKTHYVLNDIGVHKAIIVSLRGYRIGAKTAAEKLGVEIWGREELKNRLGTVQIARLEQVEFMKISVGFSPSVTIQEAERIVESSRSKRFGKEEYVFTKLVYVPFYLIDYSYPTRVGIFRSKDASKRDQTLCNAIDGNYHPFMPSMAPHEIEITAPTLAAKVQGSKLQKEVEKARDEYAKYVTRSAKEKRIRRIEKIMGPVGTPKINIDKIAEIYYPFYAGLLKKDELNIW